MIRARWVSAVRIEMKSSFAISWFVWPRASRRSTSCSRSESGSACAFARRGRLGCREAGAEQRVDVAAARGDLVDRLDELGVGGLLQQVPVRARCEGLADVRGVVLHREHEHLRRRAAASELGQHVDAAPARHDDVEQHHVRVRARRVSATASSPSAASPTTSIPASASSSFASPARTSAWSSQIRTRTGVIARKSPPAPCGEAGFATRRVRFSTDRPPSRQLDDERRPGAGRRLELEAAAEEGDALAHPDEAERAFADGCRVEAGAVVLDHRPHDAAGRHDDDADRRARARA